MYAIRDEANKIAEKTYEERVNSLGAKKRPTTAVVAGAKNLRALQG